MAVTSQDRLKLYNDSDLRTRVGLAAMAIAGTVLAEANTVPGHNARSEYAIQVINGIDRRAPIILQYLLATASSIPANISDAMLESAISAAWSTLAGVFIPE